jgi:hypothetical protein
LTLIRIEAPHFVAGATCGGANEVVRRAAPIVAYMKGWSLRGVYDYCSRKGWKVSLHP